MQRVCTETAVFLAILTAPATVFSQVYTISARPALVNYLEGQVYLDDGALLKKAAGNVYLQANDILASGKGKAEVFVIPGVVLRMGEGTVIRMISPSLLKTQVELLKGEVMLEVDEAASVNNLQLLDGGASVIVKKPGLMHKRAALYRLTAGPPPVVAVISGRAEVTYADRKIDVRDGSQVAIGGSLDKQKFEEKQADDLYAWTSLRSHFEPGPDPAPHLPRGITIERDPDSQADAANRFELGP